MSEVWNHFVMAENRQHVTCRHCSKVMKRSDSSTKSMWGHLYARHKDSVDERCFNRKRKRRCTQRGTASSTKSPEDGKSTTGVVADVDANVDETNSRRGSDDGVCSGGGDGGGLNGERPGGNGSGGHPPLHLFGATPPLAAVAPLANFPFPSQMLNPFTSIYPLLMGSSSAANPSQLLNEMVSRSLLSSMMNTAACAMMQAPATQPKGVIAGQPSPRQPNGGAVDPEGEVDEELVVVEDPVISPVSLKRTAASNSTRDMQTPPHHPRHACESTLLCTIQQIAFKMQLCFTVNCSGRRPTFRIHRSDQQPAGDVSGRSLELEEEVPSGDILCVERHNRKLVSEERWKKDQLSKLIQAKCKRVFNSQ